MNVLICTVGGTPQPLIESIKKKNPDFVHFIASQETIKAIGEIVENTNLNVNMYKSSIIEDAESIIETYEVSRGIIKKINEEYSNAKIFINHTGGTKSMSAGVVLAGSDYGCSFVYVGGKERDKEGVGIVTGDMIVKDEQYPYYLIVEKNLMDVVDYFNRYQYETGINILKDIDTKLIDNSEKSKQLRITVGILNDFINLIRSIDSFKFKKIGYRGQNKPVLAIVNDIMKKLEMISFDSDILKKVDDYLTRSEEHIKELQDGDPGIILCELINNAKRRISEGKYDDAVARLYRAVELIAQMKLREYGLDDLSEGKFTIDGIKSRGADIEKYRGYADEKGKVKLGLKMKFELLKDLGWKRAEEFYLENKKIKGLLIKRNSSILAHGLEPIDKESAEGLLSEIEIVAEDTITDYRRLSEEAGFPKL